MPGGFQFVQRRQRFIILHQHLRHPRGVGTQPDAKLAFKLANFRLLLVAQGGQRRDLLWWR